MLENKVLVVPILEFYYPCQVGDNINDYESQNAAAGAAAFMSGKVPVDYNRIRGFESFIICLIAAGNQADDVTAIIVNGGAEGEQSDTKADTFNKTVTYVSGQTLFVDITAEVNAMEPRLEAGELFGLVATPTAKINLSFLGIRGKYSPLYPVQ